MDLAELLPPLIPVLAALAGALRAGGPDRARLNLKFDAEVASTLPEQSGARQQMLAYLEEQVADFVLREKHARRDIPMAIFAALGAGALTWLSMWLVGLTPWWWLLAAPLLLLAAILAYGFAESLQRIPRDEKGVALKSAE